MKNLLLILIGAFLLSACAGLRSSGKSPSQQNDMIKVFFLKGRISITLSPQQKGLILQNQSIANFTGQIAWQHGNGGDEIVFFSPLNNPVIRASQDETHAELHLFTDTKEKVYQAKNMQVLLREQIGWELPIDQLANWIVGNADGDTSKKEWEIYYLEYQDIGKYHLPKKIVFRNAVLQMRMKWVIDAWIIDPAKSLEEYP